MDFRFILILYKSNWRSGSFGLDLKMNYISKSRVMGSKPILPIFVLRFRSSNQK